MFDAGEFGRASSGGDQQEPDESNESCLRRRTDADLHVNAARFIPPISRVEDVRFAAATVTATLISMIICYGAVPRWLKWCLKSARIKQLVQSWALPGLCFWGAINSFHSMQFHYRDTSTRFFYKNKTLLQKNYIIFVKQT